VEESNYVAVVDVADRIAVVETACGEESWASGLETPEDRMDGLEDIVTADAADTVAVVGAAVVAVGAAVYAPALVALCRTAALRCL
jgi:hypothetical protein